MPPSYVHGYDAAANRRLHDQAETLADLLHADTAYPAGCRVLEAGCGVGAQTVILAARSPHARFTSLDISAASLAQARKRTASLGLGNVEFLQADILDAPFASASFDHAFVCFLLEHLIEPERALRAVKGLIRTGGTITVVEGDHGSAFFHPDSACARAAIACQVELQRRAGGDADIGRRLYPLMCAAGLESVRVAPRMVYADASRPQMVDGFTRRTFTAMIEGVREDAIAAGLATAEQFDRGVRDLHRTARDDGVFCYTFFKGVGVKGTPE